MRIFCPAMVPLLSSHSFQGPCPVPEVGRVAVCGQSRPWACQSDMAAYAAKCSSSLAPRLAVRLAHVRSKAQSCPPPRRAQPVHYAVRRGTCPLRGAFPGVRHTGLLAELGVRVVLGLTGA